MKYFGSKILAVATALIVCQTITSCNIFNPTESASISDRDSKALTYEGYIKFRNNEYSEAEKYFNKAIAADSTNSEAWLGLIKAKMNTQGINAFELLPYVNANRDKAVPFADMDDSLAQKYQNGIDSITATVKKFVRLDSLGKLDGTVSTKNIADGYMILQMTQTMLHLRKTTSKMDGCLGNNSSQSCDMGSVLNSIKQDPEEVVGSFHEVFNTCEKNPESMTNLFEDYLPGFEYLASDKQSVAVGSMCGALSQETGAANDSASQEKTLNTIISLFGFSNNIDDDGDGCVDEEVYDGEDNDGDGEIDEDNRDDSPLIEYDMDLILKNSLEGKRNVNDLMIVKTAAPNEKYEKLDLDMNGVVSDEWEFIYPEYKDRKKNNDHRFTFAADLVFNPQRLDKEVYLTYKRAVAKDTDINNIKYDLEFRKNTIGGCWISYDEKKFKQWFMGR